MRVGGRGRPEEDRQLHPRDGGHLPEQGLDLRVLRGPEDEDVGPLGGDAARRLEVPGDVRTLTATSHQLRHRRT